MNNAATRERRARAILPDTLAGRFTLVMIAFVAVTTAVFTGFEYARGRSAVLAAAQQSLDARASLLAERLAGTIADRLRLIELWTGLDASQDLAVDDVDKRLSTALARLVEGFTTADVALGVDTAGRVIAASDPSWIGRRAALGDRAAPMPADPIGIVDARDGALLVSHAEVRSRTDDRRLGALILLTPFDALIFSETRDAADALRLTTADGRVVYRGTLPPAADTAGLLRSRAHMAPGGGLALDVALVESPQASLRTLRLRARQLALFAALVLGVTVPGSVGVAAATTRALKRLTVVSASEQSKPDEFREVPAGAAREVRVLASALADMVTRLDASRHALARQESLAAMGTMAAGLAHEVRTPLAVIRTSADIVARHAAADARAGEMVGYILEEVDRLERLVDELLVFARPRPPERAPYDVAQAATRAVRSLENRAAETGVRLVVHADPAPVRADADQILQILLNLLTNALEASPPGGTVTLTTGVEESRAKIEVADTGPGVPADRREEIFRPFFTTRARGTGLGLSIVRRTVEAHGGTIAVDDAPGGGARFTVWLPAEAAQ